MSKYSIFPHWIDRFIGIEYEACDCWSLIRRVYWEQWTIALPQAPGGHDQKQGALLWQQEQLEWIEIIDNPWQLGDILAFCQPRFGWHAAMVIVQPWMLHAEERIGSVRERYDRPYWLNHLAGAYRHPRLSHATGARQR